MKKYNIVQLSDKPYDFLIIAASYENPLDDFETIKEEIGTNKARLLFDLTLINGTKKNQYIQCTYNVQDEIFKGCSIVSNVDTEIQEIAHNFFRQNPKVVQDSIIPKSLKYLLQNKLI